MHSLWPFVLATTLMAIPTLALLHRRAARRRTLQQTILRLDAALAARRAQRQEQRA